MYDPPAYDWVISYAGAFGMIATTSLVLYRGARSAGSSQRQAALLAGCAASALGGWFATTVALAGGGHYLTRLGKQPPWLIIAAAGFAVCLLAIFQIPVVARALDGQGSLSRLIVPQTFRVLGISFILMMAAGHLPALFALPAGLGDIAVGIAAPFIARRLATGTGRRAAVRFTVLGITDLVVAVTLGVLTGYRIVHTTPANDAIALLPLATVPTFAVPLLLALHIAALRRLQAEAPTRTPLHRTADGTAEQSISARAA